MSLPRSRHALEYWIELAEQIGDAHVALFLDFDELLVPISPQLRKTVVFSTVHQQLQKLASSCHLTILSGHDYRSVAKNIDIPGITYVGNDGLDIRGPTIRISTSEPIARQLDRNLERVNRDLGDIPHILIEASRFSLTIDYSSHLEARSVIEATLADIVANDTTWKKSEGDGFYELHPNLFFNRQTSICKILQSLQPSPHFTPILISYDVNQRDTLLALGDRGIGIQVTPTAQTTSAASYYLRNAAEVVECLSQLQFFFEQRQSFEKRYER